AQTAATISRSWTDVADHRPASVPLLNATNTTSTIVPRSNPFSDSSWRSTHAPTHGRKTCPRTNGASSCSTIRRIDPASTFASVDISHATRAGVAKTPIRLDIDALTTAAATLPPAIRVLTTQDCT